MDQNVGGIISKGYIKDEEEEEEDEASKDNNSINKDTTIIMDTFINIIVVIVAIIIIATLANLDVRFIMFFTNFNSIILKFIIQVTN